MKQETADAFSQSTVQKVVTVAAGVGGISLTLADVATFAQQIGMIVGCLLVSGQAFLFFRKLIKSFRSGRASNDH